MLVNSAGAAEAAEVAAKKRLGGVALHFGCGSVPAPYGLRAGTVPHRVVIDCDGRVAHNLDGLQGLGKLPMRLPTILQQLGETNATRDGSRPALAANVDMTSSRDVGEPPPAAESKAVPSSEAPAEDDELAYWGF